MSDESTPREIVRQERGRFAKGAGSPNPGGRPKEMAEVVELARDLTPSAIQCLADIFSNPKVNALARVRAAEVIIDRGYGKPAQALDVTGMGTQVLAFKIVAGGAPEAIEGDTPSEIEGGEVVGD